MQKNSADSTLQTLEATIEVPLLVADNESIEDFLNQLQLPKNTIRIDVFDNKNSLVTSRETGIHFKSSDVTTYEKEVFNKSNPNSFQDPFGDDEQLIDEQLIGKISIQMKPYLAIDEYISNPLVYIYNLVLLIFLTLIGIWIYIRLKAVAKHIKLISKYLTGSKIKREELESFTQFTRLYNSANIAVENISKQDIQLANLQQEIQYAREDSNLELNRFLEFLIASEHIDFNDNLRVFVDAVLFNKTSDKSFISIPREISQNIARHSDLMIQNNVIIFDNIFGKLEECRVFIDKAIFSRFLNLFIEQVILLCNNSEIKINADINSVHGESHMLRLSFESNSKAFQAAFEHQTLFDFLATSEVAVDINNASFIACKHLLQKTGGDYIYLENEIRFEFPVLIEKNTISADSLSLIKPLEIQRSLLVFDSDPTERIVLMGYLDKFGQNADKATTKQVTLQKIRQNYYDILCVNSDFFSSRDPYFLTNFKSEYLSLEQKPMLLVISSSDKIINNDYFQSFDAKLLRKPIDLEALKNTLINLS